MSHDVIEKISKKILAPGALLALLLLTAVPYAQTSPAGEGWLTGWVYRRPVNITEQSGDDLTNYQVRVFIDNATNMNPDFSDLRFTDEDGSTLLDYWIENYNTSENVVIWVRVPLIPASDNCTIYMYYGNPGASSVENGEAVFDFFDDFDTLDPDRWTNTGSASVSGSELLVQTGSVYTDSTVLISPTDGLIEAKVRWTSSTESYSGLMISDDQATSGSNGGADALVYYMTQSGNGDMQIYYWAADGSTSSYNLGYGYMWTATLNVNYIIGLVITSSNSIKFYRDYQNIKTISGSWNYPFYLWFGYFTGSVAGGTNVKDIKVDWVRVRKYANPEPTYLIGEEQLSAPTLLEPADGAMTNDNTPTFRWENRAIADNYEIWVDNDPGFTSPEILENTMDNFYTPAGLSDENHSWRVRAWEGASASNFSFVWTLLIDTVAPPPPSSSPDDGLVTNDNTPALDWASVNDISGSATGEAAGFANYEIWIDNDPNFADSPFKDNSTTSSYTLAQELVDENYTFKVRAWDIVGNVGEWSDNWTFLVDTTDFLVSASSTALDLLRGGSASVEVSAELTQGESENVNWSYGWEGTPPSGVTVDFNPENIAMPCSFDLTFNTKAGADTGEFVYHIIGTSADPEDKIGVTEKSRTIDITLTVAGMIFSIDAYPRELELMRSDTVSSTILVEFLFGSRENVNLSVGWVGTDPGISYNLEPSSSTPPFNSTLTLESSEVTTAGSYTFRVTAYGSGITRIVDIPVDVVIALTPTLNVDEQSYKRGQEIHISGEVVDPKGNPVGNGTAMITLSCGGWSEDIISTIANGMYSADYLIAPDDPGGEWTIAVDAEDNRGNITLTPENITVNVTTDLTVTATTDASAYEKGQKIRISGTAKDPKGNPVENGEATITLKSGKWTDQLVTQIIDGTYLENYYITFDKPEGEWTITVTAADDYGNLGQVPENVSISVSIPASWRYYTITFLNPVPGTVCSRGSEVTVTVQITEGSEKVSEAEVYLATPSGEIITLMEGSPGIYSTTYVPRWDDPVGEWTVSVLGEKTVQDVYKAGTGSTSLEIAPADLELELLEPSQRTFEVGEKVDVKVRVNYPDGSPVDGAIVIADSPNGENLTLLNEGEGIYREAYSVGSKDLGAWGLTVSAIDAYGNSGTSSAVPLSVKELSPSSYPIRYWWITIPVILACALVPLPTIVKKLRIRKLKSIKSEIRATEKLRGELPKRYFVKGAISRETYDSLMHQSMEKLVKLKKDAAKLKKKLEKS